MELSLPPAHTVCGFLYAILDTELREFLKYDAQQGLAVDITNADANKC